MVPTSLSPRPFVLLFLLPLGWAMAFAPQVRADGDLPADTLHITAVIDGSGDLHVSHKSRTWVHRSWGQPKDLQINGCKWDSERSSDENQESKPGVVAKDLDSGRSRVA